MSNKNPTISFAHLGDCIIDVYTSENKKYLGGTAFNSAFFSAQAGAVSTIISAIGEDSAGKAFLSACEEYGIGRDYVQILPGKTSTLAIDTSEIDNPQYSNWQLGVLEKFGLNASTRDFLASVDIAKMSLFWPLKTLFEQFIDLKLPNTIKMADFSGVSMYTENLETLQKYTHGCDILVKSLDVRDTKGVALLKAIAEKENKLSLALLGEKGSIVFSHDKTYTQDALLTRVVDSNGAGDSFLGYFGYWYVLTQNIPFALENATRAASEVIQHKGAIGIEFSE